MLVAFLGKMLLMALKPLDIFMCRAGGGQGIGYCRVGDSLLTCRLRAWILLGKSRTIGPVLTLQN